MRRWLRTKLKLDHVSQVLNPGDTVIPIKAAHIGVKSSGLTMSHVGVADKDVNATIIAALEQELRNAKLRGIPDDHAEIVSHNKELAYRRALRRMF